MRARMALKTQNIRVELREVLLRDKPSSLLTLSPKGTVPVLQTDEGEVIDESLDIMSWALPEQSPWFALGSREEQMTMAATFDRDFKPHLDAYKYHRPEGEFSQAHHRGLAAASETAMTPLIAIAALVACSGTSASGADRRGDFIF
jgi:glutathione S-transferase